MQNTREYSEYNFGEPQLHYLKKFRGVNALLTILYWPWQGFEWNLDITYTSEFFNNHLGSTSPKGRVLLRSDPGLMASVGSIT